MQQVTRSDPAPSRLRYRMQRMMLTPLYRLGLRVGLPFAIAFGGLSWWLSVPENLNAVTGVVADLRTQVEQRPEFMVQLMAIDGASEGVAEEIRTVLPVNFPISSFDLDLDAMRDTVNKLDAVETARLRIRQGGVLQIDVDERVPVVLWRTASGLALLDKTGVYVGPSAGRSEHPELPVIAGPGAERSVPEALALLEAARPLWPRMRGLQRMGARRWDVVLDRNQRIQLPENGAVLALERTIAMDQAVDMLERDIEVVDLRLPQRPTLRMSGAAVQEWWRIKAIEFGEKRE